MNTSNSTCLTGYVFLHEPKVLPASIARVPGVALTESPQWGSWAAVASLGEAAVSIEPVSPFVPFPEPMVAHDSRLSEDDRASVRSARAAVRVTVSSPGRLGDPFEGRKRVVGFLGALLGENGGVVVDATAQRIWSRRDLDDELSHDAPLHIDQMYTLHAVSPSGSTQCTWLHSHGLDALGAYDFDILAPHPANTLDHFGIVRAAALASVEGRLRPGGDAVQLTDLDLPVAAVGAEDFMRKGARENTRHRDVEEHTAARMVLCEPRSRWSLLRPRPARLFQCDVPDGTLVMMSKTASDAAARRARGTYSRLQAIATEFASLGLPTLVKLGYETDARDGNREYMWFEVNAFGANAIDATLTNVPRQIARMHKGDRAAHSVDLLADWTVLTPLGPIQPHRLSRVREVRENREQIVTFLAGRRS